ncbi:MAG: hypothetical protein PVI06_17990, partial [Desulfobacterales bacterium]
NKNRRRVLPFSAAIALCPLEAPVRSSCREKNTPIPQIIRMSSLHHSSILSAGADLKVLLVCHAGDILHTYNFHYTFSQGFFKG